MAKATFRLSDDLALAAAQAGELSALRNLREVVERELARSLPGRLRRGGYEAIQEALNAVKDADAALGYVERRKAEMEGERGRQGD